MVDRFARDWHAAGLEEPTVALLVYAEKLTREPSRMTEAEVEALRTVGWDERAITDAVQVCSYFNYINRIADGLGLEPESWIDELGYEIPLGADPVATG